MTPSDASTAYSHAARLWRWVSKWNEDQVSAFLAGTSKIHIDAEQAIAAIDNLFRTRSTVPRASDILNALRLAAPFDNRDGRAIMSEPPSRGELMTFPEHVRAVIEGRCEYPEKDPAGVMAYAIEQHRKTGASPMLAECMKATDERRAKK